MNDLILSKQQEILQTIIQIINAEQTEEKKVRSIFLLFNNTAFQKEIIRFFSKLYSHQIAIIQIQDGNFEQDFLTKLTNKKIKIAFLKNSIKQVDIQELVRKLDVFIENDQLTKITYLITFNKKEFKQAESELLLFKNRKNCFDLCIVSDDLQTLIESAVDKYWSNGVRIKTQKDLFNLENINQIINEYLQNSSIKLETKYQEFFFILQGLEQEFKGNFEMALDHYQLSLEGYQQLGDKNQEKWVLIQITHCYFLRAYWEKELTHSAWQKTRYYLSQSLQLLEVDGWKNLRDDSLILLGRVLRSLEDWEQLKRMVEGFLGLYDRELIEKNESLENPSVSKQLASKLIEAYALLGECFIEQWQFQEATVSIQRALEIYYSNSDILSHFHSWLHYLLGRSLMGLKEEDRAIKLLESAKDNIKFEADPQLYLEILIELRYCYCKQQDALKILEVDQLYQLLEYRLGKRTFIGSHEIPNSYLSTLIHPLISVIPNSETLPTELTHSQRTQDLAKIQTLISENQVKILIIYAEKGVGKTSLIHSGLIPNLQNNQNSQYLSLFIEKLQDWQLIFKQIFNINLANNSDDDSNFNSLNTTLQEDLNNSQTILTQLQKLEKEAIQIVLIIDSLENILISPSYSLHEQSFWHFLGECLTQTNLKVIFSITPDSISLLLNYLNTNFKNIDAIKQIVFYPLKPLSEEQTWQVIQGLSYKTNLGLEPELVATIIKDLSDRNQQINCRELQIIGTVLEDQKIKTLKQYQSQGKDKFINYYINSIIKLYNPINQKNATICLYLLSQFDQSFCLKNLSEMRDGLGEYNISISLEELTKILTLLVKSGLITTIINNGEIYWRSLTQTLAQNIRSSALVAQYNLVLNNSNQTIISSLQTEEIHKETLIDNSLIKQKNLNAQLQLEDAQSQYQNVLIGIRLERQSLITTKQFESQQIEGLLLALKAGKELQQLLKDDTPLIDYPSISPLLALQNILSQIYERNRLQQSASITDLQINPNSQLIVTASSDGNARIWDMTGKKRATLTGHQGAITGVRWSSDGAFILTASVDQTARLWNAAGELLAILQGHKDWVRSAQFSPDNQWIVTASRDATIRLWDLSGAERSVFTGHQSWVRNAEFSPNSQYILTASKDTTARIWNLRGEELLNFKGHQSWVRNAHFSADGQLVVTASADGTARIWDLSGKNLAILQGHHNWVRNAEFSPNGDFVVTASADATARIWDLSGKAIAILQGHYQGLYDAHFSPNSQFIVTTSSDKTARLWNRKGKALVILRGHQQDVYQAEFSRDSHFLVTVSADKTARLWDLSDKGAITLRGHTHWVRNAHFNHDCSCIVTTSRDKTARLWNNKGKELVILEGHQDWVRSAQFSPNGQLIATASADKTAQLWSSSGKKLTTFQGHYDAVLEVQFSPNGQYLLTASKDKTARVWTTSGRTLAILRKHQDAVYSASFSPDGQFIVTASGDGTACVWDIIGREMATCQGHEQPIYSAKLNSDNELLVTASADKTARLWDITGKQIAILAGHHGMVYQANFSPDERLIVTASADKTACIWGCSGQKLAVLYGHQGLVSSAEWSPDGQLIVTASEDGTARLWDRMGRELATLQGHQSWVRTAEFSPDGHWIITASTDGTAKIWHIDSLEELLNKGCDWLQDYLSNNTLGKEADRTMIKGGTEASVIFNCEGEATILSNNQ